jgi:hypothetical protein
MGATPEAGGTGGAGSSSAGSGSLLPLNRVMRITVNPLTQSVTAKLL